MKKSIKLLVTALLVGVMTTITACGGSNASNGNKAANADGEKKPEKVQIRLAHDNSVETPGHKAFLEFEKLVEEKSGGRIDVTIFPGAQLGNYQEMFEQTRRGDIEMSVSATTLFTQTIPEFAVWDSFYMFDDEEHAHKVLDGKAGQELMKPLDAMGLTGLGYMEIGFRNFSNSKNAIVNFEDLKGLKLRGYNPIQIKAWEALGTNLTSLSWSEVFTSLQQNLIDGQECASASFYNAKFYEAQKYWSLTKHIYTNWLWFANKDFMNSLSSEDRKIIEDASKEAIKLNREMVAAAEKETLEKLPGLGVEVNEVSLETRNKMGELMNNAIKDEIISKCGQELYDMVNAEIEAERK
ncbi:TRAP transporter substrate-binding protein [Clostridium sediminicola]|uniref:TRAP transporter substrate-binding protein n=1 Tax=Clostridium sediminicola TaxID=3114879 RepID=UPI0031F214C7